MQASQDAVHQHIHLPQILTPFMGREDELREISCLLEHPDYRLLTIIGPGGVGKTRLAIEAAKAYAQGNQRNIHFVALQPVQNSSLLAQTIAESLGLLLSGQEALRTQLLNHLRGRSLLLLLDNFEQLLAYTSSSQLDDIDPDKDAVGILTDLLHVAPDVRLLVTSREALNVQEEQIFVVHGLPISSQTCGEEKSAVYAAVDLFAERAARVRRTFSLTDEEADVIYICQLVEGIPLAIELAASWTKSLTCAEIAAEIQRSLSFLTTNLRNMPARHRSMQAVFEQSWQRLSATEQAVLQRLSVFRGGFRRDAAEVVAGASLHLLSALVDRSLLYWEPDGRYQIHELLRQFAEHYLCTIPNEEASVRTQHADYYVNYIYQYRHTLPGEDGGAISHKIDSELGNIRQAWNHAIQTVDSDALVKLSHILTYYFDFRGRAPVFVTMIEQAVDNVRTRRLNKQNASLRSLLLTYQGWSYLRVGRLQDAKEAFTEGQHLLEQYNLRPTPEFNTDPIIGLGVLANSQGDYETALQLGGDAYARCVKREDKVSIQLALYTMANAKYNLGQIEEAVALAQRAHRLAQEVKLRWFEGYLLHDLGIFVAALGEYERAQAYMEESYRAKAQFNDPEGMALALVGHAKIAHQMKDFQKSVELYIQSIEIYRQIGDRGGLVRALNGLGQVMLVQQNLSAARAYFCEALQMATEMEYWPVALSLLLSIAKLAISLDLRERAIELLSLVVHHPASIGEAQKEAQSLLTKNLRQPTTDETPSAGDSPELVEVIASVLSEFTIEIPASDVKKAPPKLQAEQPLIEPLTERELEVLHLLADGLTNLDIAQQLIIAVGTVKAYTANIYGKLGVHNRTSAVKRARELNLLDV